MLLMPNIIETVGKSKKGWDIPTKLYNDSGIITLFGEVSDESAYTVITQLLWLDTLDEKENIKLYINSPGGSVYAGLAIYDTIKAMSRKVDTIVMGMAASMGHFLLVGGTGERKSLPNSRIMAHSVSSGMGGTVHDMKIDLKETEYLQDKLMKIISENTKGKLPLKKLEEMTLRDRYLSPEECIKYGFIDSIIEG